MATTLLAGNVLRTPLVPGAQLRNERGLLPASVLRSPFVPGARLSVASDSDAITAALYNLADLDTLVTELEFMGAPTWQELRSEPGSGSVSLDMEDPALTFFANDGTDIVYFSYRGAERFEMIPNRIREIFIATQEEPDEITTYTGLGVLGVLLKAIVFPTGGPGRSPIEEDRHIGWMSREFDHTGWDTGVVYGDISHSIDVISFIISQDPDDIEDKVRQNLPFIDLIPVIGPLGATVTDAVEGDWYVYEDETTNPGLNIAADGDYYIYFGPIDDEGEFYLDGQQVASLAGSNAFGVTSAVVSLTAGPHSVAAHIRNLDFGGPLNGTSYSWQISTEPTTATLVDPGGYVDHIACVNGDALILAYPPTVPGQAITKTFRILLEEAQARGKIPNVVCMFSDTNYSDGRVAEPIPDFGTKVGTNLMNVAREIAATYVDLKAKVVVVDGVRKIGIYMWEKDTFGTVATGVAFERAAPGGDDSTGNLNQYERDTEILGIDDALVRWDGGWTLLDGPDGPYSAEAPLEIGAPASIEEVQRMTQAALDDVNTPQGEITAGLEPRDASEAPYTGFDLLDVIPTTPTGAEQVVGWTFSEDADGNTVIKVTLGTFLLSTQSRQSIELAKAQ